jgi:SAM-dependent methyltransferase
MGIDVHTLNFLKYARKKGEFGNTITIGRQELHVNEILINSILNIKQDYVHQAYCEQMLIDYFGASNVDSIDNSSYENATYIHDMNKPLPLELYQKYDTVIDGGTLEHVYNAPRALENFSHLCKPGGQILHILPANNFCGHGFWQISPELFFSLYSTNNGYGDTEVFVADLTDRWKWYQVRNPTDGKRVNISSPTELWVMARTVLKTADFSHSVVQQSDYIHEWEHKATPQPLQAPAGLKGRLMKIPVVYKTLFPFYRRLVHARSNTRLTPNNPGISVVNLE